MQHDMTTAMMAAAESARRDNLFRRYVDMAVNEAMRHVEHIESDVDRRDFHHVALVAAMATLRLAIDGDGLLKNLEAQRDAYQKMALKGLEYATPQLVVTSPHDRS